MISLAALKSPLETPKGICVLLVIAIYLLCQCAVNWSTLRDNCRKDTRWAGVLNAINFMIAVMLVGYVCYVIVQRSPAPLQGGAETIPDAAGSSLFD